MSLRRRGRPSVQVCSGWAFTVIGQDKATSGDRERSPILRKPRGASRRSPARDELEEDDRDDRDRGRKRMAKPVTPPREPPPKRPPKKGTDAAALDQMLNEELEEVDHEKLAELKLASLRESLQNKKAAKASNEPGATLATRAAAVAETAKKKRRKSSDKAVEMIKKAFTSKKPVKEEVDYDDDDDKSASSGSYSEESDEDQVLGGSLGSKESASGKQRKLRVLREKRPGRLLNLGYQTMHDQLGTQYGSVSSKKHALTPVAVRYLLSLTGSCGRWGRPWT